MSETVKEARQLYLFEDTEVFTELNARLWQGSFNRRESTLQQLSPYVGKMKSGMARALINLYSSPGDIVFDPFSGSGVVPLEAALAGRCAWANDLSPYAYVLTRGKLEAPGSQAVAIEKAKALIDAAEQEAPDTDTRLTNSRPCTRIATFAPGCWQRSSEHTAAISFPSIGNSVDMLYGKWQTLTTKFERILVMHKV